MNIKDGIYHQNLSFQIEKGRFGHEKGKTISCLQVISDSAQHDRKICCRGIFDPVSVSSAYREFSGDTVQSVSFHLALV